MRPHDPFPVIRLEIETMKHAILHAFADHIGTIDKDVKEAVERFCTPQNIAAIVSREVNQVLEVEIKSQIGNFFRYGGGQQILEWTLKKKLEEYAEIHKQMNGY